MTNDNDTTETFFICRIGAGDMALVEKLENSTFITCSTDEEAVKEALNHYAADDYYRLGVYRVSARRVAEIG